MVRYLHIRQLEAITDQQRAIGSEISGIANRGGATIAYTELDGCLCLAPAWCSESDNFDRAIGRKISSERLKTDGPWDIIEAKHPRSKTIADWASENLYDEPVTISSIGKHWVIVK